MPFTQQEIKDNLFFIEGDDTPEGFVENLKLQQPKLECDRRSCRLGRVRETQQFQPKNYS
jgi:hypothetical protein